VGDGGALTQEDLFQDVEYVAAEKIGAETVTYVSSIYKHYIAHSLIMEAKAEREKAVGQ